MRISDTSHYQKYSMRLFAGLLVCLSASLLLSAEEDDTSDESALLESTDSTDEDDPVAKNGPIFENWPRPQVALMFSGEMEGFLEPCGCAGLDNQLGGLMRRHTLINELESQGWPVVSLDMGGLVRRIGPQSEVKYRYALESLVKLGYQAIGFGARDLQLSSDALLFVLANLNLESSPLVSANIGLIQFDSPLSQKYQVIEAGGKRIGVTAVLGRKHLPIVENNSEIHWKDPTEALNNVMPALQGEQCDLLVLMVHADPNEADALARKFPQFDLVATTGGAGEPPNRIHPIEGTSSLRIEAGHKGMYVIVLGIYDDPEPSVRFQRVPLDHRFDDSPEMKAMLVTYQEELKRTGLDGLGVTGVKNPNGQFVGSAVCADCHTEATEIFEATPHAHATETLVHLNPQRHFDPECLSCHATGWNPQKYFPYASGFLGLESTPHLTGNGCENCHGPGGAHAAAESGEEEASDEDLERLRAAMRLKIVENEGNLDGQVFQEAVVVKMCMECHDTDNSPDFDFQEYWPQVEHEGKY